MNLITKPLLEDAEVMEELSETEIKDRYHLEQKVDLAFCDAGIALRQLRDRRLYRSTHKTFEEYCRERFGFTRANASYLITGARVVDNLRNLSTNGLQILPTSERQVRPLAKLKSEQQPGAWQKAVERMGNKAPSGKVVQEIVDEIVETNPSATKSGKRTSKSKKKSSNLKSLALVPDTKSQEEQMIPNIDQNSDVRASSNPPTLTTSTTSTNTAVIADNNAEGMEAEIADSLRQLDFEGLLHVMQSLSQYIGFDQLSELLLKVIADKKADFCNKCLATMDEQDFSQLKVERINFKELRTVTLGSQHPDN